MLGAGGRPFLGPAAPIAEAAIASFEVKTDPNGVTTTKVRFWDKRRALEVLARHFGVAKEGVDIGGAELKMPR